MNATDELRRLLDEHGIEWWSNDGHEPDHTEWVTDSVAFTSLRLFEDGRLAIKTIGPMTPEQAIEATIGKTTTRNGKIRKRYGRDVPLCECCGYAIGDARYKWCPNCGARIVE